MNRPGPRLKVKAAQRASTVRHRTSRRFFPTADPLATGVPLTAATAAGAASGGMEVITGVRLSRSRRWRDYRVAGGNWQTGHSSAAEGGSAHRRPGSVSALNPPIRPRAALDPQDGQSGQRRGHEADGQGEQKRHGRTAGRNRRFRLLPSGTGPHDAAFVPPTGFIVSGPAIQDLET